MNRKFLFKVALGISLLSSSASIANAVERPQGKQGNRPRSGDFQRRQFPSLPKEDIAAKRQQVARQLQQQVAAERLERLRQAQSQQAQNAAARKTNPERPGWTPQAQLNQLSQLRAAQVSTSNSGNNTNSPSPQGNEWSDRKVDRIIQFAPPFEGVQLTKDKNGNIVKVDLANSQIKTSPNGNPWDTSGGPSTNENNHDSSNSNSGNNNSSSDNSGGTTNSNGSSNGGSSGSGTSSSNPTPSGNRVNNPRGQTGSGLDDQVSNYRDAVPQQNVADIYGDNNAATQRGTYMGDGGNPENPSGGGSKFQKPILAGTDSSAIPDGWGLCYTYTNEKGEAVEIYCQPGSKLEQVLGPGLEGDTPPYTGGSDNSNGSDGGAAGGSTNTGAGSGSATAPGTGSEKGGKKKNKNK